MTNLDKTKLIMKPSKSPKFQVIISIVPCLQKKGKEEEGVTVAVTVYFNYDELRPVFI